VGITTISLRGRYLSILPWAVGEFFAADAEEGVGSFEENRFHDFLFRVQFLILACTFVDPGSGDAGGALGSVLNHGDMVRLANGSAVPFPMHDRGPLLGTYFGPCIAMGLLRQGEEGRPFILTPRGRDMWNARNAQLGFDRAAVKGLFSTAAILTKETALSLAPHFSLKALASNSAEAAFLREALLIPWSPETADAAEGVRSAYDRFGQTVSWLRAEANRGLEESDLLARNWARAATGGTPLNLVQTLWAEFEWRRRLHYALELLLSAVATTLIERAQGTLREVIDVWLEDGESPSIVTEAWPEAATVVGRSGREAVASVPSDLFLDRSLPEARHLSVYGRALTGSAIAVACARQSASLRADGSFEMRGGAGENALAIVEKAGEERFEKTLLRLVEVVSRAHLETTFRKMERGQPCSLRFFPEGRRLLTTGRATGAGRSGPRLGNAIRILLDAGVEGLETAT
jgi:hypothetical protein